VFDLIPVELLLGFIRAFEVLEEDMNTELRVTRENSWRYTNDQELNQKAESNIVVSESLVSLLVPYNTIG
jgi:hypothetical protein